MDDRQPERCHLGITWVKSTPHNAPPQAGPSTSPRERERPVPLSEYALLAPNDRKNPDKHRA
ncbi:hypothetical protein GCM10010358_73810 [Streptomyces minutiscleroticus]|uniref:Uncharacterized protein n=1 Tax=Streptomyces minutiscleroticus TaxID=68238 RepID=A0A918P0M0_9ACTN|nr:hypothetical protein GCM10010358_73810 [Streptomyces minutiscleroticus]